LDNIRPPAKPNRSEGDTSRRHGGGAEERPGRGGGRGRGPLPAARTQRGRAALRRPSHAFHTRPRRCGTAHRRFSASAGLCSPSPSMCSGAAPGGVSAAGRDKVLLPRSSRLWAVGGAQPRPQGDKSPFGRLPPRWLAPGFGRKWNRAGVARRCAGRVPRRVRTPDPAWPRSDAAGAWGSRDSHAEAQTSHGSCTARVLGPLLSCDETAPSAIPGRARRRPLFKQFCTKVRRCTACGALAALLPLGAGQ